MPSLFHRLWLQAGLTGTLLPAPAALWALLLTMSPCLFHQLWLQAGSSSLTRTFLQPPQLSRQLSGHFSRRPSRQLCQQRSWYLSLQLSNDQMAANTVALEEDPGLVIIYKDSGAIHRSTCVARCTGCPGPNSAGLCRCLCGMCTATWCLECLIGSSTALRMPNRLWEHQWSISNGGIVLLLVSLQTEKVFFRRHSLMDSECHAANVRGWDYRIR